MCEKIFSQNPTLSKESIIHTLKQSLNLKRIVFLPRLAYDRYTHNDDINDFS
ncbi:hypothetical protein L8X29_01565 [Campylobacter lari]|nr:hypothetical protein [Campylobacter lari]MCV3378177.1 hypothetical protein [Campylobacter lari]MCV3415024.1 hypothetical protein [Campylobacter lari]MCV3476189.1 hypothetical protein [Campylobacter lari]MCV3525338.1 hypothetical protein [Campylobacter lari]